MVEVKEQPGGAGVNFVEFARSLGIVIDAPPPLGAWKRYTTEDKPRHKNGAVRYLGDHGFCQNHATMTDVAVWQADGDSQTPVIDQAKLQAAVAMEARRIAEGRARAAERAQAIVAQSKMATHPYLAAKGFPDLQGLVWQREGEPVLVVPMRIGNKLVGCQLIAEDGDKKFLAGQVTRGATFVIGAGDPVWCEGYATALSVHAALQAARLKRSVVACFSAHNLKTLADRGFVVADNDASQTGERVARETGLPYWMSDVCGEDFNDAHQRLGLFRASQSLKKALMKPP